MTLRGHLVQPDPFDLSRGRIAGERARIRMENGNQQGHRGDRLTETPWHDLLIAVFERAHLDAAGRIMSGIKPVERPIIQEEATEFLAWAREQVNGTGEI